MKDTLLKYLELDYKRVMHSLMHLWGTQACTDYLDDLLLKDHPDRQGFPFEVAQELMLLSEIHDIVTGNKRCDIDARTTF